MRDPSRRWTKKAACAGLSIGLALLTLSVGAQAPDSRQPLDVILDKPVWGAESESIGTVTDIILDRQTEQPVQIIVARRSFLGLGGKKVGLDWDEVTYDSDARIVNAPALTKDDLAARDEAPDTVEGATVSLKQSQNGEGL